MKYDETTVEYITKEYLADPTRDTVNRLSVELEVSPRSVIGKLSKLGIYRASSYKPKYAAKVLSKDEIVAHLEHNLDVDLEGLSKAQKPGLLRLLRRLIELKIVEDLENI
jgi:hypothetical protein